MFNIIPINSSSSHSRINLPNFNLTTCKNNFLVGASLLWNKCILQILDKPILTSVISCNKKKIEFIIPGSNKNSDFTMTVGLFKYRLKQILLSNQMSGNINEWSNTNFGF